MAKPPAGRPAGVPSPYLRSGSSNYQIKVKVPKGAGGPRQIARSLETSDPAEAFRRAPMVVAEIRKQIEAQRRHADGTRRDLKGTQTAEQRKWERWWVEKRVVDPARPGRFVIPRGSETQWDATLELVLGDPINTKVSPSEGEKEEDGPPRDVQPIFDPLREAAAARMMGIVLGDQVPVAAELDRYLEENGISRSYASRTRRAVAALAGWMDASAGEDNVHAVCGKVADAFAEHIGGSGIATSTLNSLTSALSAYWAWMVRRHVAERNPWVGQGRRVVDRSRNAKKRPFTDDEMKALLGGTASRTLHDMMRLAALTGMRLTEIGGLRVKSARAGVLQVETSKTPSGVRGVPVHPDLKRLVERRIRGKLDDDFLIEELTSPPSHGGLRGKKVGEAFTAYRKSLKLDDKREGRRQADADFHSFRRWFVTKAEQAGQDQWRVARVVGHKPIGMTFGTYSGGSTPAQALSVVKAVRLPPGALIDSPQEAAPEGRSVRRKGSVATTTTDHL